MSSGTNVAYAGFWRRAMALGIDLIIVTAAFVLLVIATGIQKPVGNLNGKAVVYDQGRAIPLSQYAKPTIEVTREGASTIVTESIDARLGLLNVHSEVTKITTAGPTSAPASTSIAVSQSLSWLAGLLFLVFSCIYGALMELSPMRATIGKMAMFIRVQDEKGEPASALRIILRNLFKPLSAAPLLIGFLIAALTPKKQALHDALVKCAVVVALPQGVSATARA